MKRKATRFLALAMSAVLVTSLTACGDGSDENAKDAVTPVEAQPMLSELELEILNLETKYNKGVYPGGLSDIGRCLQQSGIHPQTAGYAGTGLPALCG